MSRQTRKAGNRMNRWLFRRVGVDLHVGGHYVVLGRIPVVMLGLGALSVIAGAIWLGLRSLR